MYSFLHFTADSNTIELMHVYFISESFFFHCNFSSNTSWCVLASTIYGICMGIDAVDLNGMKWLRMLEYFKLKDDVVDGCFVFDAGTTKA